MPTLSYPNSFSAGTTIYSAEVNANFNAVSTLLNSTLLASDNIQTGGIITANLATNAVTTVKITDANVTAAKLASDSVTTAKILDANVTTAKLAAATQAALCPAGSILAYGGTSAPTGWLLCDGTSYLRATYADLFTAISTAFGAADGTHFNVPDFRGRFLRGVDSGQARDPDAASRTAMNTGGGTGDNVGSIQGHAITSHYHDAVVGTVGGGGTLFPPSYSTSSGGSVSTTGIRGGAAESTETRPINAYVNYIIKT